MMDALDACARAEYIGETWRVARKGRDPLQGSASFSRWCDGTFDVLYMSLDRDGSIAEVDALAKLQPVFPSKIVSLLYRLEVNTTRTLRLADMNALSKLGVDTTRYRERNYEKTAAIAETALFLGFDGLMAPSARYARNNLVLFTERLSPEDIRLAPQKPEIVDWAAWRNSKQ